MLWKGFPCANPLCPPTPFRNLRLFHAYLGGRGHGQTLAQILSHCFFNNPPAKNSKVKKPWGIVLGPLLSPCRKRSPAKGVWLSTTKTPQTVTLQVTILCQQISKKNQHAPEHSFASTLHRSCVTIFWQKNLTKLQLAVLPFAVF